MKTVSVTPISVIGVDYVASLPLEIRIPSSACGISFSLVEQNGYKAAFCGKVFDPVDQINSRAHLARYAIYL